MKVGIYLGYGPQTLLHKEGLGRYLATLVKGLVEKGEEVTIALPKWLVKSFDLLAEDCGIDLKKINFIIEYNTPVIWQIYVKFLEKRKPKKDIRKKILLSSLSIGEFCFRILLSTTNFFVLFILGIIALGLAIVLLPFAVLGGIVFILYQLFASLIKKEKVSIRNMMDNINKAIKSVKGNGYNFYSKVYHKVLDNVQNRLVRRINRQNEEMDIWYSPGIFWPCFNEIKGNKVINAPDLVVMDFPLHWYNESGVIDASIQSEKTILEGKYFITYCEYIKNDLLIKRYAKNDNNIRVIRHMVNNMGQYVNIDAKIASKIADENVFTKSFCRTLLGQSKHNILYVDNYVKNFDFENVRYIFYSSQARPHKNLINLLKAYQYILRKRYGEIKLFVTGDLYKNKEIKDYIHENKLQYDVLCFYNVNSQQLAALYHEAELVVNPTLYEGGFPFTFAEGMSVGVPSIMSDIPQVREEFGNELGECLFDPYDFMDIANRIEWGMNNKEHLYAQQQPIFEKMCMRNVNYYVEEYIEAFKYFSS